MTETQAQRTLVKSPPELWSELSDPEALARHLGELDGEIRITGAKPETTVAWEGERASGTVELAQSGWGTKVTLTVRTEDPAPPERPAEAPQPPEHRPRFFARLFRRRAPAAEGVCSITPDIPEQGSTPPLDPAPEAHPQEPGVEALLTGILDALGSARHRPFSRA